jgi:heme-degrading monooxygenase HmoA
MNESLSTEASVLVLTLQGPKLLAPRAVPAFFRALQSVPNVAFWKLCGTGAGGDFRLAPDLARWLVFLVWRTPQAREDFFLSAAYHLLTSRSASVWRVDITPVEGKGSWDGDALFAYSREQLEGPVAVLTRASIAPSKIIDFWRHVPAVRKAMGDLPGLQMRIGFGELPIIRQATFSIWDSVPAFQDFAYRKPEHRKVIELTRTRKWYSEEMFARFRVENMVGEIGR